MKKYYWILFCITLFLACSNNSNDDEGDMTNPDLSILSGLSAGGELKGTAEIQFSATDEGGVETVEIELNGTETITLESPFLWTFETTDYPDGNHSIAARAFDIAGNESAALNLDFTIENTFLTLTVAEGYLGGEVDYFIITDDNNELIGEAQIEDGNQYEFQRPAGFNAETYNYHRLSVSLDVNFRLISTIGEDASELVFEREAGASFDNGAELGMANIEFVNVPRHDYYAFYPAVDLNQDFDLNGRDFSPTLYENANTYYLYLISGNDGYFMEGDLDVGQNTLDLSQLSSEMDRINFNPGQRISNFTVAAKDTREMDRSRPLLLAFFGPLWSASDTDVIFHLPSDRSHLKDYYMTASFFDLDNQLNFYSTAFSENSILLPSVINASVNDGAFQAGSLNLDVSGEFDNVRAFVSSQTSENSFSWNINLEGSVQNLDAFPELPNVLRTNYPAFTKGVFADVQRFDVTLTQVLETSSTREQKSVRKDFD